MMKEHNKIRKTNVEIQWDKILKNILSKFSLTYIKIILSF